MEESRPLTASSYFNNKVAYFILVLLDLILYIYFEVNMNMPVFFFYVCTYFFAKRMFSTIMSNVSWKTNKQTNKTWQFLHLIF